MSMDEDPLTLAHLDSTSRALDFLTNSTAIYHKADPRTTLLRPSNHTWSNDWFRALFPQHYLEAIESSWDMGNYVIDRHSGAKTFEPMSIYVRLGMHLLYYGTEQEKILHWQRTLSLLQSQTEKMGREYDSPASKAHIEPFIQGFSLHTTLSELAEPDPKKYPNFNAFFSRALREGARPIAEATDSLVINSPADCRLTAFSTIDLATRYWIKGYGFTLGKLLGNENWAKHFDGGSIMIARLAPQDYHRWHSPIDGVVKCVSDIPGAYFTVDSQAVLEENTVDVFCENRRSVMLLTRVQTGSLVAIVAVGAMLVGSIKYQNGVEKSGARVTRGQCLGAFYYGGSTVIVLFPKGEAALDADLVKNSIEQEAETYVKVGWRVGRGPAKQQNGH